MLKVHKNAPLFLVYKPLYHSQKIVATLDKKVLPKYKKMWHNIEQRIVWYGLPPKF